MIKADQTAQIFDVRLTETEMIASRFFEDRERSDIASQIVDDVGDRLIYHFNEKQDEGQVDNPNKED